MNFKNKKNRNKNLSKLLKKYNEYWINSNLCNYIGLKNAHKWLITEKKNNNDGIQYFKLYSFSSPILLSIAESHNPMNKKFITHNLFGFATKLLLLIITVENYLFSDKKK